MLLPLLHSDCYQPLTSHRSLEPRNCCLLLGPYVGPHPSGSHSVVAAVVPEQPVC